MIAERAGEALHLDDAHRESHNAACEGIFFADVASLTSARIASWSTV